MFPRLVSTFFPSGRWRCSRGRVVLLILPVLLATGGSRGQGIGVAVDTLIDAAPGDSLIMLGRRFILPGSFSLHASRPPGSSAPDTAALISGTDYLLDAGKGVIRLLRPSPGAVRFRAAFEHLPLGIRDEYRLRTPAVVRDTATGRADTIYRTAGDFNSADFFGPRLSRSGSLVRGFQAGTNRDLTLNSGFRLQLFGELTNDLDITAALTDESSPIQPEGTTQTLQELDRVFIELRSPAAAATLGDLSMNFSEGSFGRLNRKLRGALGEWHSTGTAVGGVRGDAGAGAASVRGKYTSNAFRGADGVQGPYRLTGRNNEYPVIVVAGTERVYLDGMLLTRGLLNDYTIDYALGEITFTARRLVTFASRIVVEFEHVDRKYSRDILGARARAGGGNGAWTAGGMIVRENDDQDGLQDGTLTGADRILLGSAGDEPGRAARSGIDSAGPGAGRYALRDTAVFYPSLGTTVDTAVLVFNPADSASAVYNVTFSFVGAGKGDYERVAAGQYRFAGPGGGSWMPVRFLPLPERRTFANVSVEGSPAGGLTLSAEYAASAFDRNTLSGLDDADNEGAAYDLSARYTAEDLTVAGMPMAAVGITARQRRTGEAFAPPERFNDVEFERDWNSGGRRGGRDLLRDAGLTAAPGRNTSIAAYAGRLERGATFESERYSSSFKTGGAGASGAPGEELAYTAEFLRSEDRLAAVRSERLRQEGSGRLVLGRFGPRLGYRSERLTDRGIAGGGAGAGSFGFSEIVPGLSIDSIVGMSIAADFSYRRDDSMRSGVLTRAAESFTQRYAWRAGTGGPVESSLDLSFQKRRFDSDYAARPVENTALVRSLTRIAPFDRLGRALQADLFYEASPERASRLERLFIQVPRGTGNYRYAGDLNGNGVPDEPDYRPVRYDGDYALVTLPADSLVGVVSLRTSGRLRFDLAGALAAAAGWPGLFAPLSGETYLRIEEKSTDPERRNVYLIRAGTFRKPSTTLQGTMLFLQEVNLYDGDPAFSLKLRYQERRGFSRLGSGDEVSSSRERGIRLRWSLGADLVNQAELRRLNDDATASAGYARNRSVRATLVDLDWTYKPAPRIESTFGLGFGDANNYEQTSAALNAQRLSVTWLLEGAGRVRMDFNREEAVVSGVTADLPYELTQGRLPGKTWIWGSTLEYRLTQFLESSLRYEGRKEGKSGTIHGASLEARAFF